MKRLFIIILVTLSVSSTARALTCVEDAAADCDGDAISNQDDNCPDGYNPTQADFNHNDIGDVCEDSDGDGFMDSVDLCRSVASATNVDDACADGDNDGVMNAVDNCPTEYNPAPRGGVQSDGDGDGVGTTCDNCPFVENPDQADSDDDGFGDSCAADYDGDRVPDRQDNCASTFNPEQVDTDRDGRGDACDRAAEASTAATPNNANPFQFPPAQSEFGCSLDPTNGTGNPSGLLLAVAGVLTLWGARRKKT